MKYGFIALFIISTSMLANSSGPPAKPTIKSSEIVKDSNPKGKMVASPPLSPEVFPCSDCHKMMKSNTKRRVLANVHSEKSKMFQKKSKHSRFLWCYSCHNEGDKDFLKLADGSLIPFGESYKLCGQCHNDKLSDWVIGIHGKRIGNWNGDKSYFHCVYCHNAHSPKFPSIKPLPAPKPPTLNTFKL
jgi:hypothetical protein